MFLATLLRDRSATLRHNIIGVRFRLFIEYNVLYNALNRHQQARFSFDGRTAGWVQYNSSKHTVKLMNTCVSVPWPANGRVVVTSVLGHATRRLWRNNIFHRFTTWSDPACLRGGGYGGDRLRAKAAPFVRRAALSD